MFTKKIKIILIIIGVVILGVLFYLENYMIGAGEIIPANSNKKCLPWLEKLPNASPNYFLNKETPDDRFKSTIECITDFGNNRACSNCGNNKCDPYENYCNCPDDCAR